MPKARALTPTSETYNEWQQAYDHFNRELFSGQLPNCLITLQREKHTMGYFSKQRFSNRLGHKVDEIALNPGYFAVYGVSEALQTLGHEMCHQWQHHFGVPGRARYHNKEWADKMESIGLIPSSTGRPGGRRTGDKMSDYIAEGGEFEQSVERLKKAGFELIWMDRFVASPMKPDNLHYSIVAQQASIKLPGQEIAPVEGVAESDMTYQVGISSIASRVELDFSRVTQKQGTRMKYRCECGINIWAKPGIDVSCNACNKPFSVVLN